MNSSGPYRERLDEDEDDMHVGDNRVPKSTLEKIIQACLYVWNAIKYCIMLPFVLIKRRFESQSSNNRHQRLRQSQDDSRGLLTRNSTDEGEIYDLLADSDQQDDGLFDDIELKEENDTMRRKKRQATTGQTKNKRQSAIQQFLYGVVGKEPNVPSHVKKTPGATLLYQLEQTYGKDHPRFYVDGPFVKARKLARQKKKLLLLYVHAQEHNATEAFCKEVLFTQSFKKFVNKHFIPYMTPIHGTEGHALIQELYIHAFPSLVVLRCRKNKILRVGWVPAKMTSSSSARESMIQQLLHYYEHHGMQLLQEEETPEESSTTTLQDSHISEIAEQDAAYEEALRRDQEAARERERQEEEEREAQQQAEEASMLQEAQKMSIAEERIRKRAEFAKNEPTSNTNTSLIQFRFPDGSARSRRFPNEDKVRLCYEYIDCLDDLEWTPREEALWEDYELSTAFPKVVLDPEMTIGEAKISNQIIRVVDLKN